MARPSLDEIETNAPATQSANRGSHPASTRSWYKAGLKLLFGGVVAWFVIKTLFRLAKDFDPSSVTLEWTFVAVSLIVIAIASWFQALGWRSLLARMTMQAIPWLPAASIHTASMLARYTPGKVALPLIRIAGSGRLGLSPRLVGSSVGIEMISWLGVGWCVGSLTTLGTGAVVGVMSRGWIVGSLVALVMSVCGLLVLAIVDRTRLPPKVLRMIRVEGEGPLVPVQMMVFHAVAWIAWALHGALLVLAIGGDGLTAWRSGGFFVLAPIVGFLAFLAPGGLGVREAVLSIMLSPAVGSSGALVLALLARGVTVVGEILSWLTARLLELGERKGKVD